MTPVTTSSTELRSGSYVDSVALMQVSRSVSALAGVNAALVAMATDLNLELAAGMGLEVPADAEPNQMLVAVDAVDADRLAAALAEVDAALAAQHTAAAGGFGDPPPPATVAAAARRSEATVALVSTPGEYAFGDAVDALDAGLLTMVFSDNVTLAHERALKEYADRSGALLMGPDCGTAVVGGVGLGFANVVRPGPVGLVAASGTGAQHLMTLLDGAGVGVSHCLGVGGRDLAASVAGRSTHRALDLLAADPDTELVVVVSKPPDERVEQAVREHARGLGKPVLLALLGPGRPDLTATAREVAGELGAGWHAPERRAGTVTAGRAGGHLRGLFSGGTLCDEAMVVAASRLGRIESNIPLEPGWALGDDLRPLGHAMVDLGDDRFTRGRPHPMIDGSGRAVRVGEEVADPRTGVLLLDVVLGLGAAADPAAGLCGPVADATAAGVPVVVSLVGTRDDPLDPARQTEMLHEAGAGVLRSNAEAAGTAVDLVEGSHR